MATIVENENFGPEAAAKELMEALSIEEEADSSTVIYVLTRHNNRERQAIAQNYQKSCGKDLVDDLKSKFGSNMDKAIEAMMTPPRRYMANELKKAMKGFGTDEAVLIEIICTLPNNNLKQLQLAYKNAFGSELESDIVGETSGHFRKLLVSQCQRQRDESYRVDPDMAAVDAQEIIDAGVASFGTDECTFNKVLCLRNWPQLRATFKAYKAKTSRDIEDDITNETSGHLRDGYLAIVKVAKDVDSYYAEKLYESMQGVGAEDDSLIRIVVGRSEDSLQHIQIRFVEKYGKTLAEFLSDNCSGDYKIMLQNVIHGN